MKRELFLFPWDGNRVIGKIVKKGYNLRFMQLENKILILFLLLGKENEKK